MNTNELLNREIYCVDPTRERASEVADGLRRQGRNPKIHKRVVRAQGINEVWFVVVVDKKTRPLAPPVVAEECGACPTCGGACVILCHCSNCVALAPPVVAEECGACPTCGGACVILCHCSNCVGVADEFKARLNCQRCAGSGAQPKIRERGTR